MTNKEKQIPKLINDHDYMLDFFNDRIKDVDQKATKVIHLESYKVKAHFDDKFFHYVIYNKLTLKTVEGLRKRYSIICISFSSHGRQRMYQSLELIYKCGFSKGDVIVPRPLWYIDKLMAAFYVAVPGDNLLEHIKNGYLDLSTIKKIAIGLSKLHDIKKPITLELKKHDFSPAFLDATNVVGRPYNANTQLAKDVLIQFKRLQQTKHKLIQGDYIFSQGDFHPENIIINRYQNNQLAIIDFSEVCLAPAYYDIASFLQQIKFMTLSYLTPKEHDQIEYIFLSTYFKQKKIDQHIQDRINLYKSWTALKSTVYFMIFEDQVNRRFAEYLLTQSEDLYRQIKL